MEAVNVVLVPWHAFVGVLPTRRCRRWHGWSKAERFGRWGRTLCGKRAAAISRSLCPAPGGAAAQRLLRRLNGRFWAMPAAGPPCLPAQVFVIFARACGSGAGPLRGFLKVPRRRQTVPRRWRRWQGHVVDRLAPEGPSESMPPLRHRTSDARLDGGAFEISAAVASAASAQGQGER